jgi:DNA-binding CsgD family transcriptional regulator
MRYKLTAREYEIIQLLLSGHDAIQISEMLYISKNTVRKHIANIYNKLGVSNRYQLYKRATQLLQQFEF